MSLPSGSTCERAWDLAHCARLVLGVIDINIEFEPTPEQNEQLLKERIKDYSRFEIEELATKVINHRKLGYPGPNDPSYEELVDHLWKLQEDILHPQIA
jgi:hypothetical protein